MQPLSIHTHQSVVFLHTTVRCFDILFSVMCEGSILSAIADVISLVVLYTVLALFLTYLNAFRLLDYWTENFPRV